MLTSLCPSPLEEYIFRGGIAGCKVVCVFVYECMLSRSVISDSLQPPVALQAPVSMGLSQTRILEWVAIPSSGFMSMLLLLLSHFSLVRLCATPCCCLMRSTVVEPICTPSGSTCECLLFHGLTNRGHY